MPLFLLDLDNTVADRDTAFAHWMQVSQTHGRERTQHDVFPDVIAVDLIEVIRVVAADEKVAWRGAG